MQNSAAIVQRPEDGMVPQPQYRVSLEEELLKHRKLKVEDIETIQQWLLTQPHLPPTLDIEIAHFLHACVYDIELTKTTIEYNRTHKNVMKDYFDDWNPMTNSTLEYAKNVLDVVFLPKTSPGDSRIIVYRFKDTSPSVYSLLLGTKWTIMSIQSLLFTEGLQGELKMVFDSKGYTLAHIMRNSVPLVKQYNDYNLKAAPVRVGECHFVNSGPVITNLMTIVKPFLGKTRMKMMNFHTSPNGFFKHLPKEVIPSDYGGSAPSMDTLNEENIKRVEETKEALIAFCNLKADEARRRKK